MEVLPLAKGTADGVDVQHGVIVGVNIHSVASHADLCDLNILQVRCEGVINPQFVGFGLWNREYRITDDDVIISISCYAETEDLASEASDDIAVHREAYDYVLPFIYLFARRILTWGKDKAIIGKFCTFCLEKGEKGGKKLQEKAGKGLFVALLLFVGIPLPGTGAWTGTLAASLLDMDFKQTVLAVMAGVLLAGVIMLLMSGTVI